MEHNIIFCHDNFRDDIAPLCSLVLGLQASDQSSSSVEQVNWRRAVRDEGWLHARQDKTRQDKIIVSWMLLASKQMVFMSSLVKQGGYKIGHTFNPNPCRSFTCISGPATAMARIVSEPMASTMFLNYVQVIRKRIWHGKMSKRLPAKCDMNLNSDYITG